MRIEFSPDRPLYAFETRWFESSQGRMDITKGGRSCARRRPSDSVSKWRPKSALGLIPGEFEPRIRPMSNTEDKVRDLLHEAGETHHIVFRLVDGADDDWASWYAEWLIDHSELPEILGARPVRSELTWLLVQLDKDYVERSPKEQWDSWYARRLVAHFAPA